jgi:hypothetical protein
MNVVEAAKTWAANRLAQLIIEGGEVVSIGNFEARKRICEGCELYGKVEPLPGIILDGCTKCGCPTATKAKLFSVNSEAVAAMINLAAKPGHEVIAGERIICPHPTEGNKWAQVDNKFQNL